eukprot:446530-Amphidinium_carterae.1
MLFQLFTGSRADAARRAKLSWFQNLEEPESRSLPSVTIPAEVTKQKKEHWVPLQHSYASLLHGWFHRKPLEAGKLQWPFPEQVGVSETPGQLLDFYLYPGAIPGGCSPRNWEKPI